MASAWTRLKPCWFATHCVTAFSGHTRGAGWMCRRAFAKKAGNGRKSKGGGNHEQQATPSSAPGGATDDERRAQDFPWLLFGAGGVCAFAVGTYSAMLLSGGADADGCAACGACADDRAPVSEATRRRAYDVGSNTYEHDVCAGEGWMGIAPLRKALLSKAAGQVLEVAAGTGHNFPLYPPGCKVTAIDCSHGMVAVARDRMRACQGIVAVEVMEAEALQFRARQFDTVVDTFGLCSYEDPVLALREMARVCKPEREGGQLLLLEHGRSSWAWPVSFFLDRSAPRHAAKWGCWWNRDIAGIVRSAGLTVLEEQTHHLGTTTVIVAAPPSDHP